MRFSGKEKWSYLVYGIWFLAWVVLELFGLRKKTPWFTLSQTSWSLEKHFVWLRIIFFAGLTILTAHIAFGFPHNPLP